jgi:hypothetical protein
MNEKIIGKCVCSRLSICGQFLGARESMNDLKMTTTTDESISNVLVDCTI